MGYVKIILHSLGKTALHWAASVNNVDGIRLLLQSNANKDIQDHKVRLLYILHTHTDLL